MSAKYLHLHPESNLPPSIEWRAFRAVVIIDLEVTPEWQQKVSEWLCHSGCLYMMAWGNDCSSWDDSVDHANLKDFDYGEMPEDKFVMTTWHDDEPLEEVFWFSKHSAFHPDVEMQDTLLVHISDHNNEQSLMSRYENA